MLAHKDGDQVRLISRQGKDFTRRFPELVASIKALRWRTLILDGEVAVYDQQLVSRFEWLRGRPKDEVSTPPMFMAFDCLQWDEADVRLTTHARRHLRLEGVAAGDRAMATRVSWRRTPRHPTLAGARSSG